MSLTFIIGRSGSGKSTYILDSIRKELIANPQGPPIVLLVPEQATFQMEHALVKTEGLHGLLRAQVLSFRRLAYRVMQETGGTALTPINEEGKKMLLYKILQRRKTELPLFSSAAEQFGFIEKLNKLFDEMKRYRIQAADIDEHLSYLGGSSQPLLSAKLKDIGSVLHEFESELANHYLDGEDVLMRLAEHVPESTYVKEAAIWIDSFHGFTPQELSVLASLLLHAKEVKLALTLDRPYEQGETPHELNLFHPTATTYCKVREMAETLAVPMGELVWLRAQDGMRLPRARHVAELAHLEQHFERPIPWKGGHAHPASLSAAMSECDASGSNGADLLPVAKQAAMRANADAIRIHAAVNRRAEVEACAADMLHHVRTGKARWRDMAVMVRNIGNYAEIIKTVFQDAKIPYFMDHKRGVLHHPFAEMTRSLFDIILGYWRPDVVFRFVKTGFILPLDGSVTRLDFDRLENYVLATGIEGSRWTNGKLWPAVPSLSLEVEEEAPSDKERSAQAPEWIEELRQLIVKPISHFEQQVTKAKTVEGKCKALYEFFIDLEVPKRLEQMSADSLFKGDVERAREHRQMWGAMIDIMDQMVEMVGQEEMSVERFFGMLETGLESLKMALVPPALDQVLIASMDRTRPDQLKHLYVLGVNDGIIPARPVEDGILTENERDVLQDIGLELAPGIRRKLLDERFLIYTALTASSESLWVSYALADEEGKALLASEVIRLLRRLFPELEEHLIMAEPNEFMAETEQMAYIAHPEAALRHLIGQLREWRKARSIKPLWWEVYRWFQAEPKWHDRLRTLTSSLVYRNQVEALNISTSRKLYGKKLRTSVSRMERFVACPFSHFASHGLKLKERQVYRLAAPDIGQLFHAALTRFAMDLKDGGREWAALTPEEMQAESDRIVDELAPRLQGEILLSTKRYQHISRKLKRIVERAVVILGEHAKRGDFEPLALEMDFGPNKPLPPLTFTLENGCTMEIIGRIDRVDCADSEQGVLLRVIDYKSSQTDLKLHEVYYGLSLQMLTYLDVLLSNAEEWLGQEVVPAGTLYFHVHNPLLVSANGMTKEQAEDQMLKKFKLKGLVLADREVVSKMDAPLEKGYSDILPVAVKQDGSFYSNASVATTEQWDVLRHNVRDIIQRIGTRITDGDVHIEPYRMGTSKACTFCSYKPVCQFDELMEGNEYQQLSRMSKDEVWMKLEGGGDEHGEA